MAPLRQASLENGWWVPAGGAAPTPLTHVFLNGGRLSVWPPSEESDAAFARAYAQDIACGRPTYVVERSLRGGSYRFFADFDLPPGDPETDAMDIEEILRVSLRQLPAPLMSGTVTVCVRVPLTLEHKGKRGAHLIWDDSVRTGDEDATSLRDAWVGRLDFARPLSHAGTGWGAVIDRAVYRSNGLRMPWSLKCTLEESVYVPAYEWSASEPEVLRPVSFDATCALSVSSWIQRCSICARPSTSSTTRSGGPAAAPPACPRVLASVEDAVAHYWDREVASTLRPVQGRTDLMTCGSRRCFIKGGEHRGNHIFFRTRRCANASYVELMQFCHSEKCKDAHAKIATVRQR